MQGHGQRLPLPSPPQPQWGFRRLARHLRHRRHRHRRYRMRPRGRLVPALRMSRLWICFGSCSFDSFLLTRPVAQGPPVKDCYPLDGRPALFVAARSAKSLCARAHIQVVHAAKRKGPLRVLLHASRLRLTCCCRLCVRGCPERRPAHRSSAGGCPGSNCPDRRPRGRCRRPGCNASSCGARDSKYRPRSP